MTTNYKRGYAQERWIKEQLEKNWYFVVRAGSSKGPVDLVAVRKHTYAFEKPLLIQVKSLHVKTKTLPNFSDIINRPSMRKDLQDFENLAITLSVATKIVALVVIYNKHRYLQPFRFEAGHYYKEIF